MHPSGRPPVTTSWVQKSAVGATPLAARAVNLNRAPPGRSAADQSNSNSADQSTLADSPSMALEQITRPSLISSSSSSLTSGASFQLAPAAVPSQTRLSSFLSSSAGNQAGGHSPQSGSTSTSTGPNSISNYGGGNSSGHASLQSTCSSGADSTAGQLHAHVALGSPMQQLQGSMGPIQSAEQQSFGAVQDQKDADQLEQQREANRKLRLQLYVFVLRCISYPFNAKQTATGDHRQQMVKLRTGQLEQLIQAHNRFLKATNSFLPGKCAHSHLNKQLTANQLKQLDELYERAHLTFNRRFLQNERIRMLVEAECCSQQDVRDLFKQNAERILKESALFINAQKQQQQLQQRSVSAAKLRTQDNSSYDSLDSQGPSASGQLLSARETILNSWQIKFESIIREDLSAQSEFGQTSGSSSPGFAGPVGAVASQQQLTKEQLYQMFQNILNIKKFEHQLLYNALQLDSSDEQAAAIRRELDGRVARIAELERNKKLLPKFVLKEMESLFLDETRMAVNKLMVNLDSLPVLKSGGPGGGGVVGGGLGAGLVGVGASESRSVYSGLQKFRRYNSRAQASLTRDGLAESHPSEPTLSKLDVILTFNIEVIVMEVRGLRALAPTREIYCTMEIEGSETGRLQTEHVQAKKPLWDTQGDFTTTHPLPVLKIKLYAVNQSMLSLEDKELGKLVLRPTVLSPKTPEWCTMTPASGADKSSRNSSALASIKDNSSTGLGPLGSDGGQDHHGDQQLKIRVIVRMDRPQQLKHCGFLWGIGKSTWRKFKRRYHILIQVSQYTFVMCDFKDKKAKPSEMLQLDGFTVDYIEPPTDLIMEHCSEITSAEHAHHSSHGSSSFGLAGRLAKPFLKQQNQSCSSAATSGCTTSQLVGADDGEDGGADGDQPSAIQTAAALSDELHSKFYFNVVKEGDSVVFACDDEQECFGWVMALYRATGQAHKPTPLRDQYSSSLSHYIDASFAYNTCLSSKMNGGGGGGLPGAPTAKGSASKSSVDVADQRARKHGMDEFISADPCKFQHNQLFKYLQNETLQFRLNDQFCSLGWFSSGQLFVLDEYCARYGVRTCYRHLTYLDSLLDFNQRGYFIDHTLLNYGYDFCSSFVSGQSGQLNPMSSVNFDLRPDGTVGTVTVEERDLFHCVKAKLLKMIERQIANFSYCFPYGKPEGSLKAALSLLERVLMKQETMMNQMNSMVQNEEVRQMIRKCLEQAALNDYTKLSGQANLLPAVLSSHSSTSTSSDQFSVSGGGASTMRSGQSTPSARGSPVPPPDGQDNSGSGGPFTQVARRRTQSNMSSSTSIVSATYSTSAPSASGPSQSVSSLNDSIRRSNNQRINTAGGQQSGEQQQQQQQCVTMAMIINNEQVRPQEKLGYLIRLAELCCEQVEENNEYFSDAFAWHSDLMIDHFELFWSLFSVDMDKILSELGGSSPGPGQGQSQGQGQGQQQQTSAQNQQHQQLSRTASSSSGAAGQSSMVAAANLASSSDLLGVNNRDIFTLFQVLNNHMRKSNNLECRKFKAYLCDTFKPKLLRYIDIMESTLARMVFKACEKDGQVNCLMIEQMFMRLDDLQRFVLTQLRWPDEQLAEQLHQRLKLIAYELCDAIVSRTLQAFQQLEKRSNKWTATTTSYNNPIEMIQMINLTLDTRNRSQKLCTFNGFDQMSYNSKIDKLVETALGEMQPGLMAKMLNALDSTLNKLARFDEGNLLAPILSLTYKQGISSSGRDIGKQYISFVSNCCDLIRHKINDEIWIVTLLEDWYAAQMNTICNWLGERIDHSLHDVQLVALTSIMPKIYADMSLQGVSEDKLNIKTYQTIMSRLKMEEAASLASGEMFEQPSTSIFNMKFY